MKKLFAISLTLTSLILAGCQPAVTTTPPQTQESNTQTQETQKKKGLTAYQVMEDGTSQEVGFFPTTDTEETQPTSGGPTVVPNVKGIVITENGFEPSELTFKVGTKLMIQNIDSKEHWPASDPHPVHTLCPGFDAGHALKTDETFEFTFDKAEVCTFHDHLNPTTKGKITVTE